MSARPPLPREALTRVDPEKNKLLHLMALALHERGGGMTYEEIRDRLREIGVDRPVSSLQKAWHGRGLMRKSGDGRLHLDIADPDWHWVELVVGEQLEPRRRTAPPRIALVPPLDEGERPLTRDEAAAALGGGRGATMSLRRCLVLLADALEPPPTVGEVIRELLHLGYNRLDHEAVALSLRGPKSPLTIDGEGRLALDRSDPRLGAIRREARARARQARALEQERQESSRLHVAWQARDEAERAERQAWYAAAGKAVLRTLFAGDRLLLAVVLDPDRRAFEEFDDGERLRARLAGTAIVFGLDPWSDLMRLGEPAGQERTLVDLSPPNRTRQINQRGRTLRITPELLIGGTLEITRPLAGEPELRAHLERGHAGKARRRMEADLKALWRFCEYGQSHGFVRLRWGFLDELVPVNWNVGRQPMLRQILVQAMEQGREVELVRGSAPGWADPWSRAGTFRVHEVGWHSAVVRGADGAGELGFEEIAAARLRDA